VGRADIISAPSPLEQLALARLARHTHTHTHCAPRSSPRGSDTSTRRSRSRPPLTAGPAREVRVTCDCIARPPACRAGSSWTRPRPRLQAQAGCPRCGVSRGRAARGRSARGRMTRPSRTRTRTHTHTPRGQPQQRAMHDPHLIGRCCGGGQAHAHARLSVFICLPCGGRVPNTNKLPRVGRHPRAVSVPGRRRRSEGSDRSEVLSFLGKIYPLRPAPLASPVAGA
jgi:hypothetical protein